MDWDVRDEDSEEKDRNCRRQPGEGKELNSTNVRVGALMVTVIRG